MSILKYFYTKLGTNNKLRNYGKTIRIGINLSLLPIYLQQVTFVVCMKEKLHRL